MFEDENDLGVFFDIDDDDQCEGYYVDGPDGREFDCGYEFATFGCEECIFGCNDGLLDPRVSDNGGLA